MRVCIAGHKKSEYRPHKDDKIIATLLNMNLNGLDKLFPMGEICGIPKTIKMKISKHLQKILNYVFCVLFLISCGPQEPPKIAVTGIALDRVAVTLTEGETTTLVATVTPADATDKSVIWSSSNTATATVSESGVVSAVHAGTTVITAKTNDGGITASCSITVDIAMAAITGDATNISCRNAVLSGKANLPGTTATDLTFGILYSTNSGVLIGKATQIEADVFDSDFNYSITTGILEPETTYYYRSYISQNNEITYGDTKSFKTLAVSSMIKTEDATEIDAGVATLNATLDLTDCKYDAIEYGFKLTPKDGTEGSYKANDLSNKAYSYKVETLVRDKQYDVVAYVTLDGRTYTAESKSFTTQSIKANIALNEVSNITEFKAIISGKLNVESQGQFSKSAKLYYRDSSGTTEELKHNGTAKSLTLNSDGNFSLTLQGLESDKTYYYAVVATVDGVDFASEVKSFTTTTVGVNLTANDATGITEFKGTINGTLMVTSIESVSKEVWFCYSATATTLEDLKAQGTKATTSLGSDGAFSKQLTGLTENTPYYYIACAKVNGKDYFSEVKSFKTADFTAEVTTQDATRTISSTATLNGTLSVTSIESLTKEVWFLYSETATTVDALKSNGKKVSTSLSGSAFSAGVSGLKVGTVYYFVACASIHERIVYGVVKSFTTQQLSTGAVDMGLSVKWRSCNIGASKPEEYGDYYAWGETKTKSTYSWSTYTLCKGSETTMTKYCTSSSYGTVDNKTTLEKADDVAAQKLGGNWRMPTDAEWTELRNTDNCTWTWTTENNVKGYMVTSKKTGNGIFLPAAGYRDGGNRYNAGGGYYSGGYYWSSSLYTGYSDYAWYVGFSSSNVSRLYDSRYYGRSVRPVCD